MCEEIWEIIFDLSPNETGVSASTSHPMGKFDHGAYTEPLTKLLLEERWGKCELKRLLSEFVGGLLRPVLPHLHNFLIGATDPGRSSEEATNVRISCELFHILRHTCITLLQYEIVNPYTAALQCPAGAGNQLYPRRPRNIQTPRRD